MLPKIFSEVMNSGGGMHSLHALLSHEKNLVTSRGANTSHNLYDYGTFPIKTF